MKRPLIGCPLTFSGSTLDCLSPHTVLSIDNAYAQALTSAGAVVVPIPPQGPALRALYEICDGICLPGGGDIHPQMYGQQPDDNYHRVNPAQDDADAQLLRWAITGNLPVLAICRGMQMLNVVCGGTLWPDLRQRRSSLDHDRPACQEPAHDVHLAPAGEVHRIVGMNSLTVNSVHHQGIRELGTGLTATAVAEDGLIEGVELNGHRFAIGVQWHPEELPEADPSRRLFAALVEAAAARPLTSGGRSLESTGA